MATLVVKCMPVSFSSLRPLLVHSLSPCTILSRHPPYPLHQAENMLATLEVMTLLKNDGVLPLAPGKKNIAVIGPHAKAQGALVGNYLGQICPFADDQSCVVTPFEVRSGDRKGTC